MQSTSVRVSGDAHRAVKALAEDIGLTVGDAVRVDLGLPSGREAGFARPVVIVTAQEALDQASRSASSLAHLR